MAANRSLSTGERTLQALRLIVERDEPVTPKELAYALGVSLSTAYHLVATLSQTGFVVVEPYRGLRPGPALYALVERLAAPVGRPEELEAVIDRVGQLTGCRAYLATWVDRDVEIIYVHGRRGVRELPGLGRGFRGAAHALALGKVLLAERPLEQWPSYLLEARYPSRTPYTVTRPESLQAELTTVRLRAVAYDREEFALGACCIAVPLSFQSTSPAAFAVGISVPKRRFQAEQELLVAALAQLRF